MYITSQKLERWNVLSPSIVPIFMHVVNATTAFERELRFEGESYQIL